MYGWTYVELRAGTGLTANKETRTSLYNHNEMNFTNNLNEFGGGFFPELPVKSS